jgi:hypothetical protein
MAVRNWSYIYGRRRRGINPRTLEEDFRPLGTDKVFLCRSCEWAVLRARLREVLVAHPLEALAALAALAGFVAGARRLRLGPEWVVLAVVAFWVAFSWARRRPKPMCRAIFRHFRRNKLAAGHGVKPDELEPYLDVAAWETPGRGREGISTTESSPAA